MKKALAQIHADLERVIAEADEQPIDPADIRIIARKVECQVEMIEVGLVTTVEATT